MSTKKLVKRVRAMRKAGLSFRAIEARFPVSLGAGNGTKAYRIARKADEAKALRTFTKNLAIGAL